MYLDSFLFDLEAGKLGKELFYGFGGGIVRASYREIGTLEFVRLPSLGTENSREPSSNRNEDAVAHLGSVSVVHFDHVVHVDDGQSRQRPGFQILDQLVPIGESRLEMHERPSLRGLRVTKAFKFGNVVAYDLIRNDFPAFHHGRYDGMEPEKAAVLRAFANVPLPDPTGRNGFPESLPKTGVMRSGIENGHILSDQLGFGVTGQFEQALSDGNDDS